VVRLDNDANNKVSAVVAFRGRDLPVPKGIDGGETLAWASAEELLAHHRQLASDAKAFWKMGSFSTRYGQWVTFAGLHRRKRRNALYRYTRTGF